MITHSTQEETQKRDCLIVPVWQDKGFEKYVKSIDKRYGGILSEVMETKDFEGKKMQTTWVYTQDKKLPRLLLIGLGKQKGLTVRGWKQVAGAATIAAQGKKLSKVSLLLPAAVIKKFGGKKLGKETTVAVDIAHYAFDEYKSDKDARVKPMNSIKLIADVTGAVSVSIQKGIEEGKVVAECVNDVRRLGNTPPTKMTPAYLATQATKLVKEHGKVKVKVLGESEIRKLGMGCLLGVSSGSQHEPKFIILEYSGAAKSQKPTVLVGKGITFDSGGLSLKPGNYMNDMKFDMLGAATVIGSVKAAAALKLKKNVVGLIPTCENMPDGESYRPDDILTCMNGKTVLVENTDAEGRLILSDALAYAQEFDPKEVIDFATLTGACMGALGNERSGLFSDDDKIASKLLQTSDAVGEQLWRLPLGEEFSKAMNCEVADIKNIGGVGHPRYGGASTAAAFLQFFTKDKGGNGYPWAHIDLSCSYYGGKGKPWIRWGANGFGVQTMVEYLAG